jgi:hypothetical protein
MSFEINVEKIFRSISFCNKGIYPANKSLLSFIGLCMAIGHFFLSCLVTGHSVFSLVPSLLFLSELRTNDLTPTPQQLRQRSGSRQAYLKCSLERHLKHFFGLLQKARNLFFRFWCDWRFFAPPLFLSVVISIVRFTLAALVSKPSQP